MTDCETMKAMLDRAGLAYRVTEIDTEQASPRPGGTELTLIAEASGSTFVLGFDFDGALDDIELWD